MRKSINKTELEFT